MMKFKLIIKWSISGENDGSTIRTVTACADV